MALFRRRARDTRVVEPYRGAYRWDGWGTCLYWWANTELGRRDDLADVLFGRDRVRVRIDGGPDATLDGLGLNVVRYNLGACTFEDGPGMTVAPRIPRRKQIEGFWRSDGGWDWDADPNQRCMLRKAYDAGADLVEIASVSPLWWMTANGNPCGAERPGAGNLRVDGRRDHAAYLAEVARHARDHWRVPVTSVTPFNEPSAGWWVADGKQEGCCFTGDDQEAVLGHLRTELDRRGLDDVRIAASDEFAFDGAARTWRGLSDTARGLIARVNVHGYQGKHEDPGPRERLREVLGDMPVWQSEYGDGDASGLTMAQNLSADLHHLRPRAWVLWQPVEHSNWGLFAGRFDPDRDGVTPDDHGTLAAGVTGVRTAFHVLAQYTRHIRPGAEILHAGHRYTVAAYDGARRRLTLVTVNSGDTAIETTYDLGRFRRVGTAARVWTTETSPDGRRYERGDARLDDGRLVARHAPKSVTTYEIDDVDRP